MRVHLAPGTDPAALGIPAQVGDLPVQVLFAEYRLRWRRECCPSGGQGPLGGSGVAELLARTPHVRC
ncbi:MAG: hypothetical protein U1F25_14205 [Rubrivivax sp.]